MMKRCVSVILLVLVAVGMLAGCDFIEAPPEIKEGRFNFSVTYEERGELKTITGVYVCEYAGLSWTLEGGDFTRGWDGHVEGNDTGEAAHFKIGTTGDGGDILISLGGSADYFMGDHGMGDDYAPEPGVYVEYTDETNTSAEVISDAAQIEELYGIKIVSYEYDEPIKNSFAFFK